MSQPNKTKTNFGRCYAGSVREDSKGRRIYTVLKMKWTGDECKSENTLVVEKGRETVLLMVGVLYSQERGKWWEEQTDRQTNKQSRQRQREVRQRGFWTWSLGASQKENGALTIPRESLFTPPLLCPLIGDTSLGKCHATPVSLSQAA